MITAESIFFFHSRGTKISRLLPTDMLTWGKPFFIHCKLTQSGNPFFLFLKHQQKCLGWSAWDICQATGINNYKLVQLSAIYWQVLWVKYQLKSLSALWLDMLLHRIIVWDQILLLKCIIYETQPKFFFPLYELAYIQCKTRWMKKLTIRLLV